MVACRSASSWWICSRAEIFKEDGTVAVFDPAENGMDSCYPLIGGWSMDELTW